MDIDGLKELLNSNGVYIGEAVTLVFFLLEAFLEFGRTEKKTPIENLKTFLLFAGATAAMIGCFYSLRTTYEHISPTTQTARLIDSYYDTCRDRVDTLTGDLKQNITSAALGHVPPEMVASSEPAVLHYYCLALAFHKADLGSDQPTQVGWLNQDVALGAQLLSLPTVSNKESIADVLYDMWGIHTSEYLGTGRSMPIAGQAEQNESRYTDALVREYWVPNVCANSTSTATGQHDLPENARVCDRADSTAWAWRFTRLADTSGKRIRDILTSIRPTEVADTAEFSDLQTRLLNNRIDDPTTPLLIRFQIMQPGNYVGTVGRPSARNVFFSSLADVIDLPVEDAFRQSGADDPTESFRNNDPREVFIWVYKPVTGREQMPATWRNLFAYMHKLRVDPRVVDVAEAPVWPPRQTSQHP